MRTAPRHWRQVHGKLTGWIAFAGMKRFTKTRAALYQLTLLALRTVDRGFIRFIDGFGVITRGIVATANKHAKPALAQYFICPALWANVAFQNFDDMPISLVSQRLDIVTGRVICTAQKWAMLS